MTSERIGMRHNRVFHGFKLINTAVYRDFHEEHALYSERVEIPELKLTLQAHYDGSPGRRQHVAQIQRELDGRRTAGAKQEGHDG
jgi:hypothetical protein